MATKDTIIVHCSATPPDMEVTVDMIRHWHVDQNGWSDIGYNVIIYRDGSVHGGRDLDGDGDFYEETGAHARGFNTGSIGICLIGGVDKDNLADANFTLVQYTALAQVVIDIQSKHPIKNIIGHRDVDPKKECPSFDVKALLGNLV